MKKQQLYTLLFLFNCIIAQAASKDYMAIWNEPTEWSAKTKSPEFVFADESFLYITEFREKRRYLTKLSRVNMTEVKSMELDTVFNERQHQLTRFEVIGENLLAISATRNLKAKEYKVYYHLVDKEMLTLGSPVLICDGVLKTKSYEESDLVQTSKREPMAADYLTFGTHAHVYPASDKNELLVLNPVLKTENYEISYCNGEDPARNMQITLPGLHMVITSVKFTESKDVYILAYTKASSKEKKTMPVIYTTHLFKYDGATGQVLSKVVISAAGHIYDAELAIEESDNEVIVSGLINEYDQRLITGSFYQKYSSSLELISEGQNRFSEDNIISRWDKKSREIYKQKNMSLGPEEFGLRNYKIREIIVYEDGQTVLLAENYTTPFNNYGAAGSYSTGPIYTQQGSSGGSYSSGSSGTKSWLYSDILAIAYDSNGNLLWTNFIDKLQQSQDEGGTNGSYFLMRDGDSLNFLFNESKTYRSDLLEEKGNLNPMLKGDLVLVMTTLDKAGNQSSQIVYNFQEQSMGIVPKSCVQIDKGAAYLNISDGSVVRYGILKFD